MQRAVWRKNPDTFYVAIEKKEAVLWVKNATELTGNSPFRYRKDRALSFQRAETECNGDVVLDVLLGS